MTSPGGWVPTRRATVAEADEAARVVIAARHAAVPAIPPLAHTDTEVLAWFRESVVATMDVWVATVESSVDAVMVLADGWIEHLYVGPEHTGQGLGSALVDRAKREAESTLELWTFVSNVGAQRFYERHGFVEVQRTDGDNEEGEPDIRYRWSRA